VLVDHRVLAERFAAAMNSRSRADMAALLTEDFVTEWPQSGERVRGFDNFWATIEYYPGAEAGDLGNDISTLRTQPTDGLKLVAPSFVFVTVEGGGNSGCFTLRVRYPDGSLWWVVTLYHLRDGRIARSTTYFAPEFPAPEWRARWVERIDRA
jgi:ketosteroid isomerase-like protein